MANHDYLLVYSTVIEECLRRERCRVPVARQGNRYPNLQEVVAAVEAEGFPVVVEGEYVMVLPPPDAPPDVQIPAHVVKFVEFRNRQVVDAPRPPLSYLVQIHSFRWEELNINEKASITMRGNFPLELFLVRRLAERCGQLLLYPDTGDPPVVVEAGDDVGRMASLWLESVNAGDSWSGFYERLRAFDGV